MSMKSVLTWMHQEERTVGYLASRSGIDAGRLIEVFTGAVPADDELERLSALTGIPAGKLQGHHADSLAGDALDSLRCYTVAEAAALMGVSADTVRAEMKAGRLEHVVIGARAHRIPRAALERRLTTPERARDGP